MEANEDGTEGGSHRALSDLVRRIDRGRFEPIVLTYQETPTTGRLHAAGARVIDWSEVRARELAEAGPGHLGHVPGVARAVRRRLGLLRREGIDLVHLNNSPGRGFDDWLPAARLARIPCSSHLRGPFVPVRTRTGAWLQRRFDAVLAVSGWVAASAIAEGVSPRRVRLVRDGVDADAVRGEAKRPAAEVRAELGLAPDDFVVLLPGHLRPWKGQAVALEAILRIPEALRRRVRLLLAGGSPRGENDYALELETFAKRNALGAAVRFLGARSDVFDLMRGADVVLHTSIRPEPFGLVVIEAMALGRPVVASSLGGPSEIVDEGSGVLFDPERPESLGFLLAQLAEHPELRASLGRRAQERAAAFDIRSTVASVEAAFGELLDGAASPTG